MQKIEGRPGWIRVGVRASKSGAIQNIRAGAFDAARFYHLDADGNPLVEVKAAPKDTDNGGSLVLTTASIDLCTEYDVDPVDAIPGALAAGVTNNTEFKKFVRENYDKPVEEEESDKALETDKGWWGA